MTQDPQFDGMKLAEAAAVLGKPLPTTRWWLNHKGYRIVDGTIRRARLLAEVQDEFARRLAEAPPSAPCFRCGAARKCEHRS